ncbi:histidine phosphatase family protein [Peribacillus sp. SCS-37]|uniref:histidine phosphatase family protein n=1 Tax=Paraperibacillus esterisolvens TaxID=3115296 RepID=UPI00390657D4
MNTDIYFVRHAHSIYTPDEINRPLSEKGRADAIRVEGLLSKRNITNVISSPYQRAIGTVQGVADEFELDIELREDLRERLLSTEPVDDFAEAMNKVWSNPSIALEGGESNKEAQARGVRAVKSILKTYPGQSIVLGTHGNIMVLIMNYFDTQYDFSFWKRLDMPDIYKMSFNGGTLASTERIWGQNQ